MKVYKQATMAALIVTINFASTSTFAATVNNQSFPQTTEGNENAIKLLDSNITDHNRRITGNTNTLTKHDRLITGNTNTLTKHDGRITTNTGNIKNNNNSINKLATETRAGYNRLDNKINRVSNRANAGIAAAFAAGSIPQHYAYKYNVGVAAANYRDQQALAVGFQYKITDNLVANTNLAVDSYSGVGIGSGISFGW